MGNVYANGWGVAKEEMRALRWYCMAAQGGHAGARQIIDASVSQNKIECELKDPPSPKQNSIERDALEPQIRKTK
jgi:TPR repeat protein